MQNQQSKRSQQKSKLQKEVIRIVKTTRTLKYIEQQVNAQSMTVTGSIGALVNIPQGNAQAQRIGDIVDICKIEMSALSISAFNSDVVSHARFTLFQWFPNIAGEAPTIPTLYETPTSDSIYSFLNYEYRQLYHIIWDKRLSMCGTLTVPTDKSDYLFVNKSWSGNYKPIQYLLGSSSASAGTICVAYSSDSAAPPSPTISYNFRIWYWDA